MPICKREGFEIGFGKTKEQTFHDDEEVFFCEATKQIFRDYEEYFKHIMAINSTVWQCEVTGRDNLTFAEALKSERQSLEKMELFKDSLRPVVMLIIEQAKQSSIKELHSIVSKFIRSRFFINEEVQALSTGGKYLSYSVIGIVTPSSRSASVNGAYEDTEKLRYKLKRIGEEKDPIETTVAFENIRRQRSDVSSDSLHMFIKNNVTRIDGILHAKPEAYKKYVTDRKITFGSIFIGKLPHFSPAKIKKSNNDVEQSNKKQLSMNKYVTKGNNVEVKKLSTAERERKALSLKEEMERVRREKHERVLEAERQKVEKRTKMLERIEDECNYFLTKTDDLERNDQIQFPKFHHLQTYLPTKFLGDTFMLREFLNFFSKILSHLDESRISFNMHVITRALTHREVAGPLSDIVRILLGTIFDLQKEEEEEYSVDYWQLRQGKRPQPEPLQSMGEASRAHAFSKRYFSCKIHELPIDAFTVSEVLRLHLLGSGPCVTERVEKMRFSYRNGYNSNEDPGLVLRMQQPHLLRSLKMYTLYQLPKVDIMRILKCLMHQILTYAPAFNIIDDRMEQLTKARLELRMLITAENKRLSNVQVQNRVLTNEYNQQCLNSDNTDPEKKNQLKVSHNKRVGELFAVSERDRRKHEKQVEKLQSDLINYLVYLGMDRAYRKYYIFETMPGLFIEHADECYDICLENPPTNLLPSELSNRLATGLPKNRKDLRSYLLKKYIDEEKETNKQMKMANAQTKKNKNNNNNNNNNDTDNDIKTLLNSTNDNKENQQRPTRVNGLSNGISRDTATGTSDKKDKDLQAEQDLKVPTQYELYMCTGDRHNCIVHSDRNPDRRRWSFIYRQEEIDALIEALNPLGERESELREQLSSLRTLILQHVKKCPVDILSIDAKTQMTRFKNSIYVETNRRYSNANLGLDENVDLNDVMHAGLVERILQFEHNISSGDLGHLKVKDVQKWRKDLRENNHDSQVKLRWGPKVQKLTINGGPDSVNSESSEEEDDGKYGNSRFVDPGEKLGETLEIDSEDSEDEIISLHDSATLRNNVRNLAIALLQVEQSIGKRFLKDPFGAPLKESKNKEHTDRLMKNGINRLKQWEISLMESTSYAQVFLHLNILHDSIIWSRSTAKSYCQVCRRGNDPEKMLLCDECNGGTHMFCMKPKMTVVPEGNWYCHRCVKRLGLTSPSKRTTSSSKRSRQLAAKTETVDMDTRSEISATSSNEPLQRSSGRRNNKRLRKGEIEEILEEDMAEVDNDEEENEGDEEADADMSAEIDYEEEEEEDEEDEEEEEEDEEEEEGVEEDDEDDEELIVGSEDEPVNGEDEEDDNVCVVCSYDGGDLLCVRCEKNYHLECVNLKRLPRHDFVCSKCKEKDEKKRKFKSNDSNEENDSDNTDNPDPPAKRLRKGRSSLRNSLPNGVQNESPKSNTSSRRSNRRAAEDLPLNSSVLYGLLEDIMKHEHAWPFLRPVMQSEVPDYYKIIKQPMDFAKVKSKLNMGEYQLNEEVMNDIQLVFNNCDQYNVKGNEIYESGATLEKFVMKRCKHLNLPFKPSDMNS